MKFDADKARALAEQYDSVFALKVATGQSGGESLHVIAQQLRSAAEEVERLASVAALAEEIAYEFDSVLAAHDPEHPNHRSKGGQHHNGRCCSFGNVNPSSLREFRFLRDRILAALWNSREAAKEKP